MATASGTPTIPLPFRVQSRPNWAQNDEKKKEKKRTHTHTHRHVFSRKQSDWWLPDRRLSKFGWNGIAVKRVTVYVVVGTRSTKRLKKKQKQNDDDNKMAVGHGNRIPTDGRTKKKHDYRHEAERMIGVSFCTFEKGRNARNCGFVDEDWSPVDESFSAGAASNSLRRYPSAKLGKKKIFWERKKKQQLGNVETCFLLLLFFFWGKPNRAASTRYKLGWKLGKNSVKRINGTRGKPSKNWNSVTTNQIKEIHRCRAQ